VTDILPKMAELPKSAKPSSEHNDGIDEKGNPRFEILQAAQISSLRANKRVRAFLKVETWFEETKKHEKSQDANNYNRLH
jgi:hypothetical protein